MNLKSLFIILLTNILCVLCATPFTFNNNYSLDNRKNNIVVDATQSTVATTTHEKSKNNSSLFLKPIAVFDYFSFFHFSIIECLNFLISFIIVFTILLIYPLGENAPPLYTISIRRGNKVYKGELW